MRSTFFVCSMIGHGLWLISTAMWLEIKSMHQHSDGGRTSMGIMGERGCSMCGYIGLHGS